MNKLPAKQIYVLIIIIVGIFVLSVYSTYSIFTLESSTDNIVNINTPSSITLDTETYEYKQVIVPKNGIISTDIDIYNNADDNICYGIWYKVVAEDLESKVKVYENTDTSLTTSGVLNSVTSKRVSLIIINDNNLEVKVNIGLSHEKNNESCSFNLISGRKLISSTITNPQMLANTLIRNTIVKDNSEGYLIYKNNIEKINILPDSKIYVSKSFTYSKEVFTLTEPELVENKDINKYVSNETTSYYTCLEKDKCSKLYKINATTIDEEETSISKYDTYIGYLEGESGLRKEDKDYFYFGDNPTNFIYYNCKNELDTNTCELWRIMGFYYNEENDKYLTKIIKDSSLGTYIYDKNNNVFNKSELFTYLNKDYKINNNNLMIEINYNEERITEEEETLAINTSTDKIKANVTLMKITDFLNASICQNKNPANYEQSCLNNNWLNKGSYEYTMTSKYEKPTIDPETEEEIIPANNLVYAIGPSIKETLINEKNFVRPVIYLNERTILLGGTGTIDNPYIIK